MDAPTKLAYQCICAAGASFALFTGALLADKFETTCSDPNPLLTLISVLLLVGLLPCMYWLHRLSQAQKNSSTILVADLAKSIGLMFLASIMVFGGGSVFFNCLTF